MNWPKKKHEPPFKIKRQVAQLRKFLNICIIKQLAKNNISHDAHEPKALLHLC